MICYSRMAHWDDDWVVIAEEALGELGARPDHLCVQFFTRPRKFLKPSVAENPKPAERALELEVA